MDTLFWTKLNPNINFRRVNKRFFNQYYYKLELRAHGSSFLRYPEQSFEDQAVRHNLWNRRTVNHGGNWRAVNRHEVDHDDVVLVSLIHEARMAMPEIQIRIEEPRVHVYAASEDELVRFAQQIKHLNNEHFETIRHPASPEHLELLEQGYTVSSRVTEFPIKVHVREGRYSAQIRKSIIAYLEAMPEDVQLPKHFQESFKRGYDSVWNCYFYVRDRSIVTMVSLMHGSLVRAIEEYKLSPDADK